MDGKGIAYIIFVLTIAGLCGVYFGMWIIGLIN
jgi:hypothetical protein